MVIRTETTPIVPFYMVPEYASFAFVHRAELDDQTCRRTEPTHRDADDVLCEALGPCWELLAVTPSCQVTILADEGCQICGERGAEVCLKCWQAADKIEGVPGAFLVHTSKVEPCVCCEEVTTVQPCKECCDELATERLLKSKRLRAKSMVPFSALSRGDKFKFLCDGAPTEKVYLCVTPFAHGGLTVNCQEYGDPVWDRETGMWVDYEYLYATPDMIVFSLSGSHEPIVEIGEPE